MIYRGKILLNDFIVYWIHHRNPIMSRASLNVTRSKRLVVSNTIVPRGCDPFGQHQGASPGIDLPCLRQWIDFLKVFSWESSQATASLVGHSFGAYK